MAYTTNPYCTQAQIVSALDLSSSALTNDMAWLIDDLLVEAQGAIDAYLGFSFQQDGPGSTRLYSGRGDYVLFMIDRCLAFTQVLETTYNVVQGSDGAFISQTTSTVDITADCILGPDNTLPGLYFKRITGSPFTQGLINYKVTGTFGRGSIPTPISRACIRLVVAWYKMRDTNYSDFIIEGMVRQHYQRDIPADIMQLLEFYKPRIFRG